MPPLNKHEVRVLPFIEQFWLKNKGFPPKETILEYYSEFDYKYSMSNEIFLKCLHSRGIKLPTANEALLPEQLAAIAVVANFRDQRSPSAKLKSVGVTWTQWQGWMRNNYFKGFLQQVCAVNFDDSLDVIQEGLLKSASKGNVDAIKFYLELTGRYTPQAQETVNVKAILAKVVEAIQIHVKDPSTLQAISTDFQTILSGGEVREQAVIDI